MFNALRSMLGSPTNEANASGSGGGMWQRKLGRPSTATKAAAKAKNDASVASADATGTEDASIVEGKILKSIENLAQVSASVRTHSEQELRGRVLTCRSPLQVSEVVSGVKDAINQVRLFFRIRC